MILKNINSAFTLAETLLVIAIIGVVASLTLPNLTQSTNNAESVVKLKKIYTTLDSAFSRAVVTYGTPNTWIQDTDNTKTAQVTRYGNRISEFLKVKKKCGTSTGCFTTGSITNKLNNSGTGRNFNTNTSYYKMILTDGASVSIYLGDDGNGKCSSSTKYVTETTHPAYNWCGEIGVDIDGPNNGPYAEGRDYFTFIITKDGNLYPAGWNGSKDATDTGSKTLNSNCFTNGTSCAGWVIENNNMDYLNQTSWGSGTCPNGIILNWSNMSCK